MAIINWRKIFKKNFLIFEYDKYIEHEGKIVGYFSDIVDNLIYKGFFRGNNNFNLKDQLGSANVSLSAEMLLAIKKYRLKYQLKDNLHLRIMEIQYLRNHMMDQAQKLLI